MVRSAHRDLEKNGDAIASLEEDGMFASVLQDERHVVGVDFDSDGQWLPARGKRVEKGDGGSRRDN